MHDSKSTKSWSWTLLGAGCAAALTLAAGCEDNVPYPVRLPAEPSTSPDGGVGGGGGGGVRKMVERPLFGQMPLDNRFHDPGFGMLNGVGWSSWDLETQMAAQIARVHLARTPGDQPALKLYSLWTGGDDKPTAHVIGQAKGTAGPMVVSIWLGGAAGQDSTQDATAALIGMFLDDTPGAVELSLDTDPEPVTLDGTRWQRLSAHCADGPVAFAYLMVSHDSDFPLYLSSPILVPATGQQSMRSTHQAERRPLTEVERGALRAAADRQRRRFGTQLPPHQLPRPSPKGTVQACEACDRQALDMTGDADRKLHKLAPSPNEAGGSLWSSDSGQFQTGSFTSLHRPR